MESDFVLTLIGWVVVIVLIGVVSWMRKNTKTKSQLDTLLLIAQGALTVADRTRSLWANESMGGRPIANAVDALEATIDALGFDVGEEELVDIVVKAAREMDLDWVDEELITWAAHQAFGDDQTVLPDGDADIEPL